MQSFTNPPLTEAEKAEAEREEERKRKAAEEDKKTKSRWKSLEDAKNAARDEDTDMVDAPAPGKDSGGLASIDDEDLDGVPMVDSSDEEAEVDTKPPSQSPDAPTQDAPKEESPAKGTLDNHNALTTAPRSVGRGKRMTAADMFADESGGE